MSISMSVVQAERLIGTVAFALHTVASDQLSNVSFRSTAAASPAGFLVSAPAFVIRNHAHLIHTLDDYIRDGIISEQQTDTFRRTGGSPESGHEPSAVRRLDSGAATGLKPLLGEVKMEIPDRSLSSAHAGLPRVSICGH
jgi:hypothetical protein